MTSGSRTCALFMLRRSIIHFTATLTLTLLAGCESGATGGATSRTATSSPGAPAVTAAVNPYDVTQTPGPFVCANPTGSSARYAYIAAGHQFTLVQGCSPQEIPARLNRMLTPWAFSPSGQWLLAGESSTLNPDSGNKESLCETVINSDGSGATQLFSGIPLGDGSNAAIFSPDGRYVEASFYSQAARTKTQIIERLGDASLIHVQGVSFFSGWTSQPGVAVAEQSKSFNNYLQRQALYKVGTQTLTLLQAGSSNYIWWAPAT